jgi:hypothetical protein
MHDLASVEGKGALKTTGAAWEIQRDLVMFLRPEVVLSCWGARLKA